MVKICAPFYPKEREAIYASQYAMFPYALHDFQKWAIEAIVENQHVLITAHTGSGKTLPAEFAIRHFHVKGLKTIYCSPIKSLSNQKFYDFGIKYPDISIGVITGDVKCNPDADVLIMTTEVLLNKLYQIYSVNPGTKTASGNMSAMAISSISFDMDIENELGCVIFDEVHYINDAHRGFVWENSLMMLPLQVQLVLLSATIDAPEKFAKWVENRVSHIPQKDGENANALPTPNKRKTVYLATNTRRAVPLSHYAFIVAPSGIYKLAKDNKQLIQDIKNVVDRPQLIQNARNEFVESGYRAVANVLRVFSEKRLHVRRPHVLNTLARYMFENQMLPSLCFLFSRKQIEAAARELTAVVLQDDSKVPYTIARECESIMRKLPNYEEYLNLPEYANMVALLQKGVAVHHSGILPPIREMVELLFLRGFIQILFCSETLAVGINMPVKTVIFTDITKYDGNEQRILHSHEYTQIAGRAGRLGIDTVGHVIHLTNLFRRVDMVDYRRMMRGAPPELTSKFKISFHLLLNLIGIGNNDFSRYTNKSMLINDITRDLHTIRRSMQRCRHYLDENTAAFAKLTTPIAVIREYIALKEECRVSQSRRRKEIYELLDGMEAAHSTLHMDIQVYNAYMQNKNELGRLESQYVETQNSLETNVRLTLNVLEKEGFIREDNTRMSQLSGISAADAVVEPTITTALETSAPCGIRYVLTPRGILASNVKEAHCLVFANLVDLCMLDGLTAMQLAALFSCFTSVYVKEEDAFVEPVSEDTRVLTVVKYVASEYRRYEDIETRERLSTGTDYTIHFELIDYVMAWSRCMNAAECDGVIARLEKEKGIFLGEFVKALLKINNISSELENLAESIQNIPLLKELSEVRFLTLKYVATNQSLYV